MPPIGAWKRVCRPRPVHEAINSVLTISVPISDRCFSVSRNAKSPLVSVLLSILRWEKVISDATHSCSEVRQRPQRQSRKRKKTGKRSNYNRQIKIWSKTFQKERENLNAIPQSAKTKKSKKLQKTTDISPITRSIPRLVSGSCPVSPTNPAAVSTPVSRNPDRPLCHQPPHSLQSQIVFYFYSPSPT